MVSGGDWTRKVGPVDVIFVQSPPLTIGLSALAYARLKRAPFVFNVSDIWPQSAVELGVLRNRLAIRLAEMLEMHLYRRAARVTVPTSGMLERLAVRRSPREARDPHERGRHRHLPSRAARPRPYGAAWPGRAQGVSVRRDARPLTRPGRDPGGGQADPRPRRALRAGGRGRGQGDAGRQSQGRGHRQRALPAQPAEVVDARAA